MARGNRWKNFGDAFNASYGAVTTIARDFETAKALKANPITGEDGSALEGAGLLNAQRNRYNALAGIEEKYGTAANALAIRKGMEEYDLAANQSRLANDTYDERVFQQGAGASGLLRAQTAQASSAAGLNSARARGQNISNQEAAAVLESKIAAGIATNEETAALARLNTRIASDPAYGDAKLDASIADQIAIGQERSRDANIATAQGLAASTGAYRQSLETGYEATTAQNELDIFNRQTALRRSQQPEVVAAGDQQAVVDAKGGLFTAENVLLASEAANRLASDPVVQANNFEAGVNQSATGLAQSASERIAAERMAQIDTAIRDFMVGTENAGSPESMDALVESIAKIDPIYAQQMRSTYNNAQLSEITENTKLYREKGMEALSQGYTAKDGTELAGGPEAFAAYLDDQDGKPDNVKFIPNENGGGAVVILDDKGEPMQTLFNGANAEAFRYAADRYMQPGNMWAFAEAMYKTSGAGSSGNGTDGDPLATAMGLNDRYGTLGGPVPGQGGVPDPLGGNGAGGEGNTPDPLAFNPVSPPQSPDAFASAAETLFDGTKSPAEILDGLRENRQGLQYFKLYQPYVERATAMESISNLILRDGIEPTLERVAESENAVGREVLSDPRQLAIVVQDMGDKLRAQNEMLAQRYANYDQGHPDVVRVREQQAARQQSLQRMVERLQQLITAQNTAP